MMPDGSTTSRCEGQSDQLWRQQTMTSQPVRGWRGRGNCGSQIQIRSARAASDLLQLAVLLRNWGIRSAPLRSGNRALSPAFRTTTRLLARSPVLAAARGTRRFTQLESEALAAEATSPLPDRVDRDAISGLLAEVHLRFWGESRN